MPKFMETVDLQPLVNTLAFKVNTEVLLNLIFSGLSLLFVFVVLPVVLLLMVRK